MSEASSIAELLRSGADTLRTASESPRLDAEILLGKVLGRTRAALIVHGDAQVAPAACGEYRDLLDQRRAGAPVAYLTGTREFWSLPLAVTPQVLVPRPDTETLVEAALELMPRDRACAVVDLGTGSGAIALALARERPLARVVGTDVSQEALEVASRNARALGLTRIEWRLGSWFDAVPDERFDAVLANPPYIAAGDPALAALAAEPRIALTPGPTGLEALARIVAGAARHLRGDGWIALEHGAAQAETVALLLARHAFAGIRTHADRAGLPRVTLGRIH